jgi:hypothetical protein
MQMGVAAVRQAAQAADGLADQIPGRTKRRGRKPGRLPAVGIWPALVPSMAV